MVNYSQTLNDLVAQLSASFASVLKAVGSDAFFSWVSSILSNGYGKMTSLHHSLASAFRDSYVNGG